MRKLLLIPIATAMLAASPARPADDDDGVCIGLGWLTLEQGETVEVEDGPDFKLFYFSKAGDEGFRWGVYDGEHAQVHGNGPTLVSDDGVSVKRANKDGAFRGYVATRGYRQNHFFGGVFSGTKADKAFFDRVDFGRTGQELCQANGG